MLTILLFLSLFSTFLFLILPGTVYQTSPALVLIDEVKRRFANRYLTGDKQRKLSIMGKDNKQLFQQGFFIGICTSILLGAIAFLISPVLAPIGIVIGLALGILLVDIAIENEFKNYQTQMAQGTIPLANFMPSFLEVESITPRYALILSLPFIPEPLKGELGKAVDMIARTGKAHEAMEELTSKVNDPVVEAICFRLASAWDAQVTADLFDDLKDQLEHMKEIAVTNETNVKAGLLVLISVIGLIGFVFIFGYPGIQFLIQKLTMFNF